MLTCALQSGSNGNSIYVETPDARLLFDAGISARIARQRLAQHGRDVRRVDAVIISHDHADHIRCAGVLHRKFRLPLYVTGKTLKAAQAWRDLGRLEDVRRFTSGQTLDFGAVQVQTIRTPHDGADGVAFVVAAEGKRLGILTDLGHVFRGLGRIVSTLDAAFMESNYDPEMLEWGPYPWPLKERIRGPHGHLSNEEAAELLRDYAGGGLRWACLAHLSEQNNKPAVALKTHHQMLPASLPLHVAGRYEASDPLEV